MKRTNSGRAKIIDNVLNPTYCAISPSYGILRGASQLVSPAGPHQKKRKVRKILNCHQPGTSWNHKLKLQTQPYVNNTKSYLGLRSVSTTFLPAISCHVPLPLPASPPLFLFPPFTKSQSLHTSRKPVSVSQYEMDQ